MRNFIYLILLFCLFACSEEVENPKIDDYLIQESIEEPYYKEVLPTYAFPKLKDVVSLKNTVFRATLESTLDSKKNNIYAAALLMAWDEIEDTIGGELYDFESKELEIMYNSTSHKNVLAPNEYNTSIEINGNVITAKAEFKKALPFQYPLTKNTDKLSFGKYKVSSFGFRGEESMAYLVYYNNDNDFCIAIKPRNDNHLIYLMKSDRYEKTFKENFDNIAKKREKQRKNEVNNSKLHFEKEDVTKIPMIGFNLENHFKGIESSVYYKSSDHFYEVLKAWQRTAFILNEKGAIVESEAIMMAKDAMEEIQEIAKPPTPKKLIFDKKFMVFLKRTDADNPYFALQITDTELLVD